jgi:hypothetical protein
MASNCWVGHGCFAHGSRAYRVRPQRIRCTDLVLVSPRCRPHDGRRWMHSFQRDGGCCSGGGIVSLPRDVISPV